jgi:hypothetical protein
MIVELQNTGTFAGPGAVRVAQLRVRSPVREHESSRRNAGNTDGMLANAPSGNGGQAADYAISHKKHRKHRKPKKPSGAC